MSDFPTPPEAGRGSRVLALDVGTRRTGIALSDTSRLLATPLETVSLGVKALVMHVRLLVTEHDVGLIVIGQPALLSGAKSSAAELAERVGMKLRASLGVKVVLWDETLTSWEAEEILRARGRAGAGGRKRRSKEARRGEIDRLAAAVILQDYLNSVRPAGRDSRGSASQGAAETDSSEGD